MHVDVTHQHKLDPGSSKTTRDFVTHLHGEGVSLHYLHCLVYTTFDSCLVELPFILLVVDSKGRVSIQAAVATFISTFQLLLPLDSFPRAQLCTLSTADTQQVWYSVGSSKGMLLHISEPASADTERFNFASSFI